MIELKKAERWRAICEGCGEPRENADLRVLVITCPEKDIGIALCSVCVEELIDVLLFEGKSIQYTRTYTAT